MPLYHLFIIYLIVTLIVFLPSFGLAKLFQKAGVPAWKAYIPFYNTWVMQGLAKRPKHWVFWQLIPVVGWFISPGIFIEFVKLFGRFSFGEHALAALFAPFYFPYLGYSDKVRYIGPEGAKHYKKPGWREWVDAAVFAIVAATLIRTFIFEAYTIPSGSMEKTLLVNDFLFVSKFSYGPRIPNTPLSIPFVHNYIPGTSRKSYSETLKLPYIRWFSSPVERGDVVVFNFPAGDTVINRPEFQSAIPYYDLKRRAAAGDASSRYVFDHPDEYPIAVHPVDKSDNYIKRCVGVSGDSIAVKNNVVFVNNKQEDIPEASLIRYTVITNGQRLDAENMKEVYNVDIDRGEFTQGDQPNVYNLTLTEKARKQLIVSGLTRKVAANVDAQGPPVFPFDENHKDWTSDNYGPIWIPKKGATINLTPQNYALYERAIRVYENNQFEMQGDKYILNG